MSRADSAPPLKTKRRLAAFLFGAATFWFAGVLSQSPTAAEVVGLSVVCTAWLLSTLTAFFPFAVIEPLAAWFLIARAWRIGRTLGDVRRGVRTWPHALAAFALVLLRDVGLAVGLFYFVWGFGYARAPVEERTDWPAAEFSLDGDTLDRLAADQIVAANEAYLALHETADAGAPTTLDDPAALDAAVEAAWPAACRALGLGGPAEWPRGRAKRLIISDALRSLGLSGFYCPFTGEANLNASVPAISYPQVLAHEKAHQRGINPENEANFFGWFVAAQTNDPLARYSAAVFAQRQLLRSLQRTNPERVQELVARRHPGVQRDVEDLFAYWAEKRGWLTQAARKSNDAYLRANRVEGGVQSYGRSVRLLAEWVEGRGWPVSPVGDGSI